MATVWPIQPRLLGLKDSAAYLGVSTWTIRDWLASGHLVRVTLPGARGRASLGRPFFDRLDLDQLIDAGKDGPVGVPDVPPGKPLRKGGEARG